MGNIKPQISPSAHTETQTATINQLFDNRIKTLIQCTILLNNFNSHVKFEKQVRISLLSEDPVLGADSDGKSRRVSGTFCITESIVELFSHGEFKDKSLYWYSCLVQFLKKMLKKKSMLLISNQQWLLCMAMSQFVMLLADQMLRQLIHQHHKIQLVKFLNPTDVSREQKYRQTRIFQINSIATPFQSRLSSSQRKQSRRIFRQFMYYSIKIRNNIIPNFGISDTRIYNTVEALFAMFVRLEFLESDGADLRKDITVCGYAIGLGINYQYLHLINLSISLLLHLFQTHKEHQNFPSIKLPPISTHYFKQIPVLTCKNLYQTITTYLLYTLSHRNQKDSIHIGNLVELFCQLVDVCKPKNKEILYYLERVVEMAEVRDRAESRELLDGVYLMVTKYRNGMGKTTQKLSNFEQRFVQINTGKSKAQLHIKSNQLKQVMSQKIDQKQKDQQSYNQFKEEKMVKQEQQMSNYTDMRSSIYTSNKPRQKQQQQQQQQPYLKPAFNKRPQNQIQSSNFQQRCPQLVYLQCYQVVRHRYMRNISHLLPKNSMEDAQEQVYILGEESKSPLGARQERSNKDRSEKQDRSSKSPPKVQSPVKKNSGGFYRPSSVVKVEYNNNKGTQEKNKPNLVVMDDDNDKNMTDQYEKEGNFKVSDTNSSLFVSTQLLNPAMSIASRNKVPKQKNPTSSKKPNLIISNEYQQDTADNLFSNKNNNIVNISSNEISMQAKQQQNEKEVQQTDKARVGSKRAKVVDLDFDEEIQKISF